MTPPRCKLEILVRAGTTIRMGEAMARGGVDER